MPLLTSDLYETCKACVEGNLKAHLPQFDCRQTALGVVLVSGGYPGAYPKWKEITGTSVNQASIVHHCRPVECKLWLMCSIMTGAVSAGIQTVLSLCRNTTCAVSVQEYRLCYLCAGIQAAESHGLLVFHAGTAQKDGKIVTSGGRVLAVVAVDTDLQAASERAQKGAADVRFEGSFYRSDIGHCALKR